MSALAIRNLTCKSLRLPRLKVSHLHTNDSDASPVIPQAGDSDPGTALTNDMSGYSTNFKAGSTASSNEAPDQMNSHLDYSRDTNPQNKGQLLKDQFRLDLAEYIKKYTDSHSARLHHALKLEELKLPAPAPAPPLVTGPLTKAKTIFMRDIAHKRSPNMSPPTWQAQVSRLFDLLSDSEKSAYESKLKTAVDQYKLDLAEYNKKYSPIQLARFKHNLKFEQLLASFDKLAVANRQRNSGPKYPVEYDHLSSPGWKLFWKEFVASAPQPVDIVTLIQKASHDWKAMHISDKTRYVARAAILSKLNN